jgi:hypothetical protein
MNSDETVRIEFHEQAAARLSELAQDLLTRVGSFGRIEAETPVGADLHPVAQLTESDLLGPVGIQRHSVNELGEETGRYWESGGYRVGWEGEGFESIKALATKFESSNPLRGRVSGRFLLDEIFTWLRATLEGNETGALPDFIAARCSEAIKAHEIWIPVYRTYSAHEFSIGSVQFRTISGPMLDRWYSRIPEKDREPGAVITMNRRRSLLQGTLAVRVVANAEPAKASEIAHASADEAVALLRFLSPVNWTCRITSHCLPIGKENTRTTMDLTMRDGEIRRIGRATVEEGPAGWNIDDARNSPPTVGVLEVLDQLGLRKDATEFRSDLYGALQLHARHSVASEIAHKLVFVVAAAESMFLRNSSEPIQKNLGERMAFLIGNTLDERKKLIKNVDLFYNIRSALIHHGQQVQEGDKDVVDEFFLNVWLSFKRLLESLDRWKTRNEMFTELEDRKLS